MWGYNVHDRIGIAVTNWMEDNDHFLIFDSRNEPTLYSILTTFGRMIISTYLFESR